jgi:diguanylate cyclase (GGDEF)-like protein/PAS domain S-box-containing protein
MVQKLTAIFRYWPAVLAAAIGLTATFWLVAATSGGRDADAIRTLLAGLLATALMTALLASALLRAEVLRRVSDELGQAMSQLSFEIAERKRTQERLAVASTIVEHSPTVIARWRFPGPPPALPVIEYISANFAQFGYTADDLTSGRVEFFRDIVHPDDQAATIAKLHEAVCTGGAGAEADFRMVRHDGAVRWAVGRMTFERDAAGGVFASHAVLQDITERKEAEQKLRSANTILTTAIETSLDAILVVDGKNRIISFNRRFVEMWNIAEDFVAAGDDEPVLAAVTSRMADPAAFLARVRYLYDHPAEASNDEFDTSDGRTITRYSSALHNGESGYLGRIWFFRDVTDRKRAEGQILRMARHDGLTGLANRRVFVERIEQVIAQAERGGAGFAVLYLDLDHFKDVNDTLGHPIGDELLRAFGERLSKSVRETDTVARFGGDEFAVLAANVSSPTDAGILAAKILQIASEPYLIGDNTIRTGTSIGISAYGPNALDAETLLTEADLALYRAKSEGRGSFRFFTEDMDQEVRSSVTLTAELREAIARDQLFLMYQPQVEVDTGRILGLEALVRWRHPEQGVLSPGKFIPVAERGGLIIALGHWVLRQTCRQVKQWIDEGIAPSSTAVNLSALQFKAPLELEADIERALAEVGLLPTYLELELTETALMETSRTHNDVLQRLHLSGIKLAIDDFGTGYSSLNYLRRFPVDRLKIDQDFIGRITDGPGDAAIVKAAIGLARELGIRVVAEGVETAEQLELLTRWGCEQVQGFYFSEPLPAEQVTLLLRQALPFRTTAQSGVSVSKRISTNAAA